MSATTFQDAEVALSSAEQIVKRLDELSYHLRGEISEAQESYENLKNIGGARADHAAEFLKRLRPHIAELSSFLHAVSTHLEDTIAHPFGH